MTSEPRPNFTFLDRLLSIIDPLMNSNFQVMTTAIGITSFYTSTLTFLRDVTIDDEAFYTCTATNVFGTASDTAFLTVNGTSTLVTLCVSVSLTH